MPSLRCAAMWMSSHTPAESSFFLKRSFASRPKKRDLLPCVARHTGRHTALHCALSKAQGPGLSVSKREPSGIISLSRFCATSSRSLGRCLLLGQRSRKNLLSNDVRSLVFEYRVNARTELSRHRHNGDPRAFAGPISATHRTIKFSKLCVLANRRPGRLNQFASQPSVSDTGNRAPINRIAGGVLGGHQPQKASQLSDIFDLPPVSNAGQKLTGHNPADPWDAHQVRNGLRQFFILFTKAADLFGAAQHLLFRKFQIVEQLIELKTHGARTLKLSQLSFDPQRPLPAGSRWGKVDAFEQQQGFDPLLVSAGLAHHRVAQLCEVAKLSVNRRGNMNAFDLASAQALGQSSTVEPVGLSCRDTLFTYVQSGKHIIILGYECLVSHRSASLAQRLLFEPLYQSTRGENRHPSYKSLSSLQSEFFITLLTYS